MVLEFSTSPLLSIAHIVLTEEDEEDLRKRGRVLRKLLVKLHPDQNRGREKVWAPRRRCRIG